MRHDQDGRKRVMVERMTPLLDGGRFAIKRVVGELVSVEADVFCDGHDKVAARLLHRRDEGETTWQEVPMEPLGNDRWVGIFRVDEVGRYRFTVEAWVDAFLTWQWDLQRKVEARQDVRVELEVGSRLLQQAAARASGPEAQMLELYAQQLGAEDRGVEERAQQALQPEVTALVQRFPDRSLSQRFAQEQTVWVDRERARFSAWYEFFPRSTHPEAGQHGTLRTSIERLPYVARMGFDVLYLPPIHPVGREFRKGKNNQPKAAPGDVGSPWAIGAKEGGHKAIHPDLGTLEDFHDLLVAAREHGLELAMDLAFQCAPDHPYVKEHPEWFRHRPDGTIQYAENPPKKYQDIYPFDFECEAWESLWSELREVVRFWCEQDVRIFRVDNPHTKAFAFWEWLIASIQEDFPDALFLSEAFTRPKVMYRLAKLGFAQSYTYFTWRNTKAELEAYLTELTQTELQDYFRPNLWPNTPDILPEFLQMGGLVPSAIRVILAATLSSNYGLYGPAFENAVATALAPGKEEYRDSEKFEVHHWSWQEDNNLVPLIARLNAIRRENPALQVNDTLRFHPVDNEQLIAYSKHSADGSNHVLVVINLDPHYSQSGWIQYTPPSTAARDTRPGSPAPPSGTYQVNDLLSDQRFLWSGERNYVELDPHAIPGHVLRIRHHLRTEHDFDYFL